MSNNNHSLAKVREKFTDWWKSVIYCFVLYGVIFIVAKVLINYWVVDRMEIWRGKNEKWTIFLTAQTLGFLFIADAKVSGYLKTPLARLANKVENCQFWGTEEEQEKEKKWLLTSTQEANESFKKTFEKFGIIAIPSLLVNLLDNGKLTVIKKLSNHPLFYTCYLTPMLYATFHSYLIHRRILGLEKLEESNENYGSQKS